MTIQNFETTERQALRETVHRFIAREVAPNMQNWERGPSGSEVREVGPGLTR